MDIGKGTIIYLEDEQYFTLPNYVTKVRLEVHGGKGGKGGDAYDNRKGSSGRNGSRISCILDLSKVPTSSRTLYAVMGHNGADGGYGSRSGGGGGGGGSSAILLGDILIIQAQGGAGGDGGRSSLSSGGDGKGGKGGKGYINGRNGGDGTSSSAGRGGAGGGSDYIFEGLENVDVTTEYTPGLLLLEVLEVRLTLIKSNNKYYTYQNNEFIEVEPTVENFKEKSINLSLLATPNENGIKPYKLLDKPSIVTYTEDEEIPILSQTVLASTKVRFLVSKDKINYQVHRNGKWITIDKDNILEQGMTKLELESIPQEAWAEWVENEAHKHSFNILIGMYSENPGKPLVRSVTVNYAENEAPVIINSVIEPDTIHNEFAYLMTDVKDYEGDRISFKVLIKKAGTEEFVQVDPPEGWYTGSGSEIGILRAYNHPYFNVGENEVKVVVKDERGVESEWTGRIILTNTDPTITITYDDFGMIAVIGDDDDDDIAYRLSINGELVFDYTKFFPSKKRFEYLFDSSKLRFGEENTICLEVIDTLGGYAKEEFTIIGTYRGLMFKNENGEYFVDDRGNVLMDVLFGKTLIGGQTSETKKVILENRTGFPLTDTKIFPEKADFAHGAVVEISPIEMPFTPVDTVKILEILPNLGTKDFYIRVRTSRDAYQGGYFYINSTATPVTQ